MNHETYAISEAAWLSIHGFKPTAVMEKSGVVVWSFHDSPELQESLSAYNNNGKIGITDLNRAIAMLKQGISTLRRSAELQQHRRAS